MENKYQEILNKLSFFNGSGIYDVGKSEEIRRKNIEGRKKDFATIQELIDKVKQLQKENENQSQMLKALKPYLGIKELDRKDGKGKEYRCYVKNGFRENYFDISKEQYTLFKKWLENGD